MKPTALPLVVRPLVGESGLSFASRLADVNGIALVTLLRDVAKGRPHDAWSDEQWERLALRSLLPLEAMEAMRARPAGVPSAPATVRFLEKAVNPQYLVKSRLRICPTCIGERRMLKEAWRLVHHVACSDHGVLLIDTCECGRTIDTASRHLDPFHCLCGKPFADNAVTTASELAVKGAQWMVQAFGAGTVAIHPRLWLVKGGRLGLPFSIMEPHDIMGVIDIVGQAATTPPEDDDRVTPQKRWSKGNLNGRRDLPTCVRQVEAAMEVLHDWPHAYRRLLADVAGRNTDAGQRRPRDLFATRIGQLMLTPYRGLDGQPIGALQDEVDAFLERRGYKLRQKIPTRSSATARSIRATMPRSRVARSLGLKDNNAILARVYAETLAAFDERDDLPDDAMKLGALVVDEIRRRLATAQEHMSPSAMSEYLNHPDIATYSNLWLNAGLITPIEPDRSVSSLVKGHAFLRSDVVRLRSRIADAATMVSEADIPDGFEPYSAASRAGIDAAYTGSHLLLDILSGVVPSVRTVTEPRLTDLYLHTIIARRRALAARVSRMIDRDQYAGTSYVEYVLAMLWPARTEKLTIDFNRRLRADEAIRIETKTNTTEGRSRPMYWYSLVDHMLRSFDLEGPSISADVDDQLRAEGERRRQKDAKGEEASSSG